MMMPGGNLTMGNVTMSSSQASVPNSRDFNYRIPPYWTPEFEQNYSFRAYMTDISSWILLTDLQPHQQAAAIVMRLGGAARELARMISPQEMMIGGMLQGQAVDPVTYLLGSLHARFSALEEESRLQAMTEMLAFSRRNGETINSLLARYDTVRQRAATEGQFVMSVEGCSLQILRAIGIQHQHLFHLLQPFQGNLPTNDAQFQQLLTQLRRYGHITEGAPGNIASTLSGPFRQARPGAYLASGGGGNAEATGQRTDAFFGDASQPANAWEVLSMPQEPYAAPQSFEAHTFSAVPAPSTGQGAGSSRTGDTQPAAYPTWAGQDGDSSTSWTSSDYGDEVLETCPMSLAWPRHRQQRLTIRSIARREKAGDVSRENLFGDSVDFSRKA